MVILKNRRERKPSEADAKQAAREAGVLSDLLTSGLNEDFDGLDVETIQWAAHMIWERNALLAEYFNVGPSGSEEANAAALSGVEANVS